MMGTRRNTSNTAPTAKLLGIDVPETLLATADEVIN
jgi:hypothetical protein